MMKAIFAEIRSLGTSMSVIDSKEMKCRTFFRFLRSTSSTPANSSTGNRQKTRHSCHGILHFCPPPTNGRTSPWKNAIICNTAAFPTRPISSIASSTGAGHRHNGEIGRIHICRSNNFRNRLQIQISQKLLFSSTSNKRLFRSRSHCICHGYWNRNHSICNSLSSIRRFYPIFFRRQSIGYLSAVIGCHDAAKLSRTQANTIIRSKQVCGDAVGWCCVSLQC
eukprot:Gb_40093 [translate_table: standard]